MNNIYATLYNGMYITLFKLLQYIFSRYYNSIVLKRYTLSFISVYLCNYFYRFVAASKGCKNITNKTNKYRHSKKVV